MNTERLIRSRFNNNKLYFQVVEENKILDKSAPRIAATGPLQNRGVFRVGSADDVVAGTQIKFDVWFIFSLVTRRDQEQPSKRKLN